MANLKALFAGKADISDDEREPSFLDKLGLSHYGSRCEWLKDDKFLRDLEGDSVDTEILDEELRSLQDDEPKSCRGKTNKLLESNPFQIVLCALVLIDAGIVIAEILLDLHAIRSQYRDTKGELLEVLGFVKATFRDDLPGNEGADVQYILHILHEKYGYNNDTDIGGSQGRHIAGSGLIQFDNMSGPNIANSSDSLSTAAPAVNSHSPTNKAGMRRRHIHNHIQQNNFKIRHENKRLRDSINHLRLEVPTDTAMPNVRRHVRSSDRDLHHMQLTSNNSSSTHMALTHRKDDKEDESLAKKLKEIAHILHYGSIAILGVFVLQLILKMYAMGKAFFKNKMELFDAVVILASFALDLVFLEGIGAAQGEEAAALLILFLLWRLLRVINGIMVTAKKQQEFRIKLQKRARRRGEKKIEILEEEKEIKEKEILALRELSLSKGASDEEVASCRPRRRSIFHKLDTSAGLSSIASLSLGLSMSMSGPAPMLDNVARSNPNLNRRESLPEAMLALPSNRGFRRTSIAACRQSDLLALRPGDRTPIGRASGASSMERVVEEVSSSPEEEKPSPSKQNNINTTFSIGPGENSVDNSASKNETKAVTTPLPKAPPVKQVSFDTECAVEVDMTDADIHVPNGPIRINPQVTVDVASTSSDEPDQLNEQNIPKYVEPENSSS